MKDQFVVKKSIVINASKSRVWDSLVNPEMIKKYLYGTEAVSDWKKGSSIVFKGEWEGRRYEDKGTILQIEPEKIFQYSYFSSFSGLPDIPENYNIITFELMPEGGKTRLTLNQENINSKESRDHSDKNWSILLDTLKKMLE